MSVFADFIDDLSSPDRLIRIAAAEPLAALGKNAKDAIPGLQKWLQIEEPYFRVIGAATILKIDPSQVGSLLPVLNDGLQCEPCPVRSAAAEALGDLGPAAMSALPALQKCLEDQVASIRCEAAVAIWKITGDPSPAVQNGVELLNDPDWMIRCLAAEHLGLLGSVAASAIPALEVTLRDEVGAVRNEVEQAIAQIVAASPHCL
jgi:HEAT repeat protein